MIDYLDSGTVEEGAWKARDMDDQLVIVGFSGDCSEAEIKREVVKAFREAIGASNSGTSYEEMGGPISVIHDASKDIYWVKWNLFGAYLFKHCAEHMPGRLSRTLGDLGFNVASRGLKCLVCKRIGHRWEKCPCPTLRIESWRPMNPLSREVRDCVWGFEDYEGKLTESGGPLTELG